MKAAERSADRIRRRSQLIDQLHLEVSRNRHAGDQPGPSLDGWGSGDVSGEPDRGQVIVKVMPLAAMEGVAALTDPGTAFFPVTNAPEIPTARIHEKNFGSAVGTLRTTVYTARSLGERGKVGVIRHSDEKAGILLV